jgi:type I restriction enzyme S subunit
MTGTSGRKRLEAPILEKLPIAIPPIETLSAFEQTCGSFFKLMTEHTKQNQELTALRDWLLPMLMNGQVTVR